MDIEKKLNRIIEKYHLNEGYPEWDVYNKASQLIVKLLKDIPEETVIAIRGAGGHTEHVLSILSMAGLKHRISYIVDKDVKKKKIKGISVVSLEKALALNIECYILSSFRYEGEMYHELKKKNAEADIIKLYSYFRENDLPLNREFYAYKRIVSYSEIFYMDERYKKAKTSQEQAKCLQMLVALCLNLRDFVTVFSYMQNYIDSGFDVQGRYGKAKKSLEDMFFDIEEFTKKRRSEDIVINWVDAVPFTDAERMPFLKAEGEQGIKFMNAFSPIPYTRGAFTSIFRGKDLEEGHSKEQLDNIYVDSPVLNLLKKEKYEYVYVCPGVAKKYAPSFAEEGKESIKGYCVAPDTLCSTVLQWLALVNRCKKSTKTCYLVHNLYESHFPCFTPHFLGVEFDLEVSKEEMPLMDIGRQYIDKHLEFYRRFYGKEDTIIYMSDHGYIQKAYVDETHRIVLTIVGNVPQKKEERLYSHFDFYKVLNYILHPNNSTYDDIFGSQVVYHNHDVYSTLGLERYLSRIEKGCYYTLGYQYYAIRTEKYLYVKYFHGLERFFVLPDLNNNLADSPEYRDAVSEFRKQADEKLIDWRKDDFFSVCEPLYKIIDQLDASKW